MRSAVSSPRLCVYLFACTIISCVQSNQRTSATGQQLPEQLSTVRKRCLVGNSRDSSPLSSYAVMYVCLYTLCMHLCIYAYLYICIHMNSSMSVCVYVRSGRGNVLYCRESCPGVSCPGVSCPGGGRGPFPMRRRARDLVPYATMYTSAFISVRQQAFKAPAYEGVSKCIFSCFIYYGVKANVRSFGVNSIQMLFISQTTNSKLS